MEQFIFRHIKKYIKKHFSSEYKEICRRQKEIFPKMMSNAPDLGGKENSLWHQMDHIVTADIKRGI